MAAHPTPPQTTVLAYLSLGSNVGDREGNLATALANLHLAGALRAVSSIYETQPVAVKEQPWFLNCVAILETDQAPRELLRTLLEIEASMGRIRRERRGPRKIDIDIVLYGDRTVAEPGLTIPHPEMHERRFVLEPLAEIAPEARHPILNKSAQELLAALGEKPIVRRLNSR